MELELGFDRAAYWARSGDLLQEFELLSAKVGAEADRDVLGRDAVVVRDRAVQLLVAAGRIVVDPRERLRDRPRPRRGHGLRRRVLVEADHLRDVDARELRDLVRTLTRERIAPRAAEIDASHEFPWDVVELFREQGIFGLLFDEEAGGTGTGTLLALVAIEEVSKVCATSGVILAVQELGSLGIKLAATDEQKARWLPQLASGEWLPAYALTEPGSGSDSAAMRTEARREGDEYVLNGGKRFITNAGVASLYVVFAKTDPEAGHAGISAFVVEADTPGFRLGSKERKMGIRGTTGYELVFEDARVPACDGHTDAT